jgi:hypothetical protein
MQSILHGSEKAKQEAPSLDAEHGQASGQHSHLVGRGKYVHEVVRECTAIVASLGANWHWPSHRDTRETKLMYCLLSLTGHKVKPGYVEEYKDLISQHYGKFLKTDNPDVKLTGSWEVVVGDLDTFCGAPRETNACAHRDKY